MSAFVVVGGQYGGEGKGKVANFFSKQLNSPLSPSLTGKDLIKPYVLNLQSQLDKTIDYLGFNDETIIKTEDYCYDS